MHMRTKKWAKPELAVCPYFTDEAETKRGHWREQFEQDGPNRARQSASSKGAARS